MLLLGAGLAISLCVGMLAYLVLIKLFSDLTTAQKQFYSFVAYSVSVYFMGLILIHFFLRYQIGRAHV